MGSEGTNVVADAAAEKDLEHEHLNSPVVRRERRAPVVKGVLNTNQSGFLRSFRRPPPCFGAVLNPSFKGRT